ncbi:hypothetical protein GCM10010389_41560 [Streptomyces echinoruber]|uniref:Integrase n=1 Tax=Streptomyces echinoruber TaxID=68898 RepID=A0A918VHW6_9ACTN|nr:hypothetical protein GCM10010389_41560 [Streptomyces echinoruber]
MRRPYGEQAVGESLPPGVHADQKGADGTDDKDGCPVLRHIRASIMPETGESVVASARCLGHSPSAVTFGYHAHFVPEAGGRKRGAHRRRRTARKAGGTRMPGETPRILPGADAGRFPLLRTSEAGRGF